MNGDPKTVGTGLSRFSTRTRKERKRIAEVTRALTDEQPREALFRRYGIRIKYFREITDDEQTYLDDRERRLGYGSPLPTGYARIPILPGVVRETGQEDKWFGTKKSRESAAKTYGRRRCVIVLRIARPDHGRGGVFVEIGSR